MSNSYRITRYQISLFGLIACAFWSGVIGWVLAMMIGISTDNTGYGWIVGALIGGTAKYMYHKYKPLG